ncbi:MAG: hypothetical protein HYY24_24715 [Verrucomicrobia bacterium]|nr:hypothetical protein [Verrucomicrobiota bacterium]
MLRPRHRLGWLLLCVLGLTACRTEQRRTHSPAASVPPAAFTVSEDFENTPVGAQADGAESHVENKGDSLAVTEETAASGRRSLKFQDAPGFQSAFNPRLVYAPHHTAGTTQCAFDLRVESGAVMYHEWRDDANPYRVGPIFWIRDGKLSVAGNELMAVPAGQWVHIEIIAKLGAQATGTWDLAVRLPGRETKAFRDLKTGSPDWRKLDWLGFVSNADARTAFYLDNLLLTNER